MKGTYPVNFNLIYNEDAKNASELLGLDVDKMVPSLKEKLESIEGSDLAYSLMKLLEQGKLDDKELTWMVVMGALIAWQSR